MSFISYAQNHEDVILWRALKHVGLGFYVDVGANHPADDSVTKAFYDRGWSGINIEPLAEHMAQLQAERPRDINLQVAVGSEDGEIELFNTGIRGLATASSAVAGRHQSAGLTTSSSRVPMRRLDGIFAAYTRSDVHFLKIDVEGFERSVLEGMDFSRFRPWIVVVEATIPNSQEIDANWEPILLDAGYRYVYFDGLNRYYTARERESLAAAFSAPPNVFDDFISAERYRLQQCLEASIARAEQSETQLWKVAKQMEERALDAEAHSRALQDALDSLYTSTSWRLTKPLRQLVSRLRQPHRPAETPVAAPADTPAAVETPPAQASIPDTPTAAGDAAPLFPPDTGHPERFNPAAIPNRPLPPETMFLTHKPVADFQENAQDTATDFWFRFLGHVEGHYSLAIINRGLAVALDELSHEQLAFLPYHLQPYEHPADLPAGQRSRLEAMFGQQIPAAAAERTVSIVHHYPLITDPDKARYRLVIFFWEETAVPDATISQLNGNFDAVLVASTFVKRALRNSGCRLPIFVIPVGIDHLIGPSVAPIAELKPVGDRPFRFLHISSAFERKGVDVLLRAFFGQFTVHDPVELYIKTFPNPHNRVREQLMELCRGRNDAPKVTIDETPLDDACMLDLYRRAQALVLPTRGEGFNLPAAEALALGLPVIATGYGAHLDFCTRATALPTPFRFARSRSHLKSNEACWVDPDAEALGEQMRQLRADVMSADVDLARRLQAGIKHVRQTYTWQQGAHAIVDSVRWLDAGQRTAAGTTPRRLTLLSPWMTRCGIAEYSHKLLSALGTHYALQVHCDARTPPDPEQSIYRPSWTIGDNASVCAVLDEILQERPDVLLVQHQPSLFSLTDEICQRLAALRAQGCVVIVELHSTLQLVHEHREAILTGQAITALRTLDRICVHKPEDFNHLLALGIVDNVFLLALGVVQPQTHVALRSAWGIGEDDLLLGCFGFLLPHKGIDTLIDSIAPLTAASQRKVHLLCLNATPDASSEATLAEYQEYARAQGVDAQITWITDYRPIEECIQLLAMADYVLFPYKQTRESASGAVTIGLATLKPVLVSPLPIFSDLGECTWRMAGEGVQEIVEAVSALENDPGQAEKLHERQHEWLAERSWSRISARLDAVIDGLLLDRQLDAAITDRRAQFLAASAEAPAEEAQLLVDVSELLFRDARTGIQRVVRSILGELLASPPKGFRVRPIYGTAERAYRYTDKYTSGIGQNDVASNDQAIKVRAGDVFLGLDLSAHLFPRAEAELRAFRLAGVKIHFVVYDIIPLRYPHFAVAGLRDAFDTWLHALARQADCLLCISAAVATDVRAWLSQHTDDSPLLKVKHFHLGADIENSAPTSGLPADATAILEKIRSAPSFLMVGTLEPRKGQAQALAAFEALWRQELPVNLVLIGKAGWMMDEFTQSVRNHPELGQRLFWLEGISDEFLEQVYAASTCLLAASEAEGFGLPLIEAAQHQLPIIARDIPVFREVAGEHAFYFSEQEPEVLATAIRSWLTLQQAGLAPKSATLPWLTWQQSTQQMLDIVIDN